MTKSPTLNITITGASIGTKPTIVGATITPTAQLVNSTTTVQVIDSSGTTTTQTLQQAALTTGQTVVSLTSLTGSKYPVIRLDQVPTSPPYYLAGAYGWYYVNSDGSIQPFHYQNVGYAGDGTAVVQRVNDGAPAQVGTTDYAILAQRISLPGATGPTISYATAVQAVAAAGFRSVYIPPVGSTYTIVTYNNPLSVALGLPPATYTIVP